MTEREIEAYVDAAALAQGLVVAADVRARVIAQFTLIQAIAAPVLAVPLPTDVEPANVFRP
ncbi:MAG: DUF4089 domain-containing protein [Proteobacteria bacterium]|nr:DUF4089 domain-containing protein [Pseudomonadota bacterium]